MAKNKLLLKKQRSLKAKKLTELRTRAKQLRAQGDHQRGKREKACPGARV